MKNNVKKIGYIVCAWACGIAVSLLFMFLAAYTVAFNRAIYHNSMVREAERFYGEKNLTDEQVRALNDKGLSQAELNDVIDDVLKYLLDGRELMDTSLDTYDGALFTEREILHMVDVKGIFTAIKWITISCAIIAPLAFVGMFFIDRERYKERHRKFFKFTLIGNAVFIGFMAILLAAAFDWAFTAFHHIFFSNDLWQLNANDLLIEMLPSNLFNRLAIYISLAYASLMAIFFFTGHFQKQIGRLLMQNAKRRTHND